MKIDVKLVEYLGNGEAAVELNTGTIVDIFYDPYAVDEDNECSSDTLFITDITGTIGEWLDRNTEDIPPEAMDYLQKAYNICSAKLDKSF